MVSRGVNQLKNIRLYFCDFGGSSTGVRDFLKSEELVNFVTKNESLKVEVYLKRGNHPYMSSTYINGYVKDQPLRNMQGEEVMDEFVKFNNAIGRKALLHNSIKVVGNKKSIQGMWRDNMWTQYPKHTLEVQREVPHKIVEAEQPVEVKDKIVRPHILTSYARKKFPIPEYNKTF
jgi:large subunit ribosomal protein L43